MITIRFAVVFQKDGLDETGVAEDVQNVYGFKISEIQDDVLDERIPVKIFFMETDSFGKYFRFKLDYNCAEASDQKYVLFPMERGFNAFEA